MHYLAALFTPDIEVHTDSTCCNTGPDDSYIALGDNGGFVAKSAPCTCCTGWLCCPIFYGCASPAVDKRTTEVFERTMKEKFGEEIAQEAILKVADYSEMKENGKVFGVKLFKRVVEQGRLEHTQRLFSVHTNLLNMDRRTRFEQIDLREIRARRGSVVVNPHGLEIVLPTGQRTKFDKDAIIKEIREIPFERKVSVEDAEAVMKATIIFITEDLKKYSVEYGAMMDIALGFLKAKGYAFLVPQVAGLDAIPEVEEVTSEQVRTGVYDQFMYLVWGKA